MKLELGISILLAIGAFSILKGYNVLPLVLIIATVILIYMMLQQKGLLRASFVAEEASGGKIAFTDVGGQTTAKKELMEALDFINKGNKATELGIRPLKGILLTGPPGTGKTLLAKAAATYTDAVFFATSGSEFVEMYAGVGAQRVRELFRNAREQAKSNKKNKAILFIDEIEVLGVKRGSHTSHMEYDQTLNQLLVEMDGLQTEQETCEILVIAASNRVDMIDPALLRPGRFDRVVQVNLPDKEGRLQILNLHTRNKPLASDVNLGVIAQDTFGFSGAHLESLTNEAAIFAFRNGKQYINQQNFKEAIDKVMLGEKLDRKPNAEELKRVAIHEAGHALISELEKEGSVASVTIVPRGQAMGYMRQSPESDSYLQTRSQLESQIRIILAGTVAEELVFGERSTSAANDVQEAIKLSKRMVTCGLSDLGVIDVEESKDKVGEEIRSVLSAQEIKVCKILEGHQDLLKHLALKLKEKETLQGEEIKEQLKNFLKSA